MEEQPIVASSAQVAINALSTNLDLSPQKVDAIINAVSAPVITRLERFCTTGHLDGLYAKGYRSINQGLWVKTDHLNARTVFVKVVATLGKFRKVEITSAGHMEAKLDEIPDDTKLRGHLSTEEFADLLYTCRHVQPGYADYKKFPYLGWSDAHIAHTTRELHEPRPDIPYGFGSFYTGPDWVVGLNGAQDGPMGSTGEASWITYGSMFIKTKPAISDDGVKTIIQMFMSEYSNDWFETVKTKTLEELYLMSLDWANEQKLKEERRHAEYLEREAKKAEEKRLKLAQYDAEEAEEQRRKEQHEASVTRFGRIMIAITIVLGCVAVYLY